MGRTMELLDIRDETGEITGRVRERGMVHMDGDTHGTAHIWIVREREDGTYDLLLQKRASCKDAYPGCYDISAAGHVQAGEDFLPTALRELEEELITSYWGDENSGARRRYYSITEKGKSFYKENQADWQRIQSLVENLLKS